MKREAVPLRLISHYYKQGRFDPKARSYDEAFSDNYTDEEVCPSAWIVLEFDRPVSAAHAVAENIRIKRLNMKDCAANNFNIIKGSVSKKSTNRIIFKPHINFFKNDSTFDWNKPIWNGIKPGYEYEISLSKRLGGESWTFKVTDLEYGLYWFKDAERCSKYVPGRKLGIEYYNPNKPVMLFVHGWERTTVNYSSDKLRDFRIQSFNHFAGEYDLSMKEPIDLVKIWKKRTLNNDQKEWNFGVLYWNQFSDDDHEMLKQPAGVEAKIWTTRGPKRMRYAVRRWNGAKHRWMKGGFYSEEYSPDRSISGVFTDIVRSALNDKRSADFRIMGHSMGNQVATALAYNLKKAHRLQEIGDNLFPKRLALVDPYWSRGNKEWMSDSVEACDDLLKGKITSTGRLCSEILKDLIDYGDSRTINGKKGNFGTELMSGSLLPFFKFAKMILMGDPNTTERDIAAVEYIRTEWIHPNEASPAYWGHKHVNALFSYLWQYEFPPPNTGISASSSNREIHDEMNYYRADGEKIRYKQIRGADRASPEENEFKEMPGSF